MTPPLYEIREKIFLRLSQYCREEAPQQKEALLIANDHFIGHRFLLGHCQAILLTEENKICIYNSTGRLVANLTVSELFEPHSSFQSPVRRAA